MEEFDPTSAGAWKPDVLSHEEFEAQYTAVRELLAEYVETGNANMYGIMREHQARLEDDNPNAYFRAQKTNTLN